MLIYTGIGVRPRIHIQWKPVERNEDGKQGQEGEAGGSVTALLNVYCEIHESFHF